MSATLMRTVAIQSSEAIPVLGQGPWHMAEDRRSIEAETSALRLGLDLGMTLIDTAEMYANGAAEELVAHAIKGRREEVFLVDKVLPSHATRRGTVAACEASLKRLKTAHIDLNLLHWRGDIPLRDTLDGFEVLIRNGCIRHWGVSNFDLSDMEDLYAAGGTTCAVNQVLYNLSRRGIEYDLLPWCQDQGVPIMAYSPIEQSRILDHPELQSIAERHNATPAQVALAWVIRQDPVVAIPKMGTPAHVRENLGALEIRLTNADLTLLDLAFPPPTEKVPLEMI
jgi:diketogulonate reductase-like aldo/keto reductase